MDCLIEEMFLIRERLPKLDTQTNYIPDKILI